MHPKLDQQYWHNKALLDNNGIELVQKIESDVQKLMRNVSPEQLELIIEIDTLLNQKRALKNKHKKASVRNEIITALLEQEQENFHHMRYTLKPFADLNDDSDNYLVLQEILDLPDQCDLDIFKIKADMYIKNNIQLLLKHADEIEQIDKKLIPLHAKINDPVFETVKRYFEFKKLNNYFFEIGHEKQLLKISRKTSGLNFSVVYPENSNKMILYSGKAKLLGTGNYGRVKLSQDYSNKQLCAVKVQSTFKNKLSRETEINTEVENLRKTRMLKANVTCYGRKKHYIFMDLIPGVDALDAANNNINDETYLLHILLSAANALKEFHEQNMIHRDIKFENFIYDAETDKSKLVDLSFAVALPEHGIFSDTFLLGTHGFCAPDIEQKHPNSSPSYSYSKRSDIFSFGAMMQMLSGYIPPYFNDIAEQFMKPFEERPSDLNAFIKAATGYLKVNSSKRARLGQ